MKTMIVCALLIGGIAGCIQNESAVASAPTTFTEYQNNSLRGDRERQASVLVDSETGCEYIVVSVRGYREIGVAITPRHKAPNIAGGNNIKGCR